MQTKGTQLCSFVFQQTIDPLKGDHWSFGVETKIETREKKNNDFIYHGHHQRIDTNMQIMYCKSHQRGSSI